MQSPNKNSKYKTFLDYCTDISKNTVNKDLYRNKVNIKNLNTKPTYFNMTMKKIIDDMKILRHNNKKKHFNINKTKNLQKITNSLDVDNSLDLSNNQLITYNKQESLANFLLKIQKNSKYYGKHQSFFDYTKPLLKNRNYSQPILIPPLPPPKIIKCLVKKKIQKVDIRVSINSIKDLIKLTEDYPLKDDIQYNINMKAIHNIKEPLFELENMIGMLQLKNAILDQILYFIQELHKNNNKNNNDFMHTVIYGPPGTGKTETAKIIGKIFSKLGILSKNHFKKVTRADLIAGYLGQTAIKTQKVIKECLGGVLFIDEAYSLGNSEKRDSFAKECIDTLCEALSDNKDNLMVIIAGYKKELKNCFFAYNQGLDSRFTWRFNTTDYTFQELFLIFKKKVNEIGWKLKNEINELWFEKRIDNLPFFGRDIETLLAKIKIAHGRRVFCLSMEKKKLLTLNDMNKGYEIFINNNTNKENLLSKEILSHMYC